MRTAKEIRPDHVAIYIRWSTEDQGEGTTLEVQREACQSFIISQGWSLNDQLLFIDDGVSGGTMGRPALDALRAGVLAGRIDCVVVYKLDRLSRSVLDMVKLVLDEWEDRCHVKSAREPIDTLSQAGKMFFYQLVSFAEWERSVIKERTFAGKLRRAREGKNPGITPAYGYRLGPAGELILEPGPAVVVQLIFRLYLSGMGCTQISRRLYGLGHPSPTGRRWSEGQLSRLLSNPIYMGRLVYGKQVTVRGKRIKSEQPLLVRDGVAPIIIDAATFEEVQQLKANRPTVGRKGMTGRSMSSQSLLSGLLRCSCGHSYCGNGGNGPRFRYRYYYCGGAQSKGVYFCQAGRIRQDLLDELVVQALLDQFGTEQTRGAFLNRVQGELEAGLVQAQAALDSSEREIAKLVEKESRLRSLFLDGEVTPADFRDLKGDLNRQLAHWRAQVQDQRDTLGQADRALQQQQGMAEQVEHLHRWGVLEIHERKQLVRQFVRQIQAFRDKGTGELVCTIDWHWANVQPSRCNFCE